MKNFFKAFIILLLATTVRAQRPVTGPSARFTGDVSATSLNSVKLWNPALYGAIPNDNLDDKTALQNCIDAAEAGGGGIVKLAAGVYDVFPVGTGFGLQIDSAYIKLIGEGEKTIIRFKNSTATNSYLGISPKRYTTCTAPYTAAPLWVEDLCLTADDYVSAAGADLIGICHCPWAVIRKVGFEQNTVHAFEINVSKNVLVEDCFTYGTGNFGSSIAELDGLGAAGANQSAISTAGTTSQSTPMENITIRRFVQRAARTDLTISTNYDFIILSHTNFNNVLRNVTIENCSLIPHRCSTLVSSSTVSVIGFDTGAYPLTVDGLRIQNNIFSVDGGLSGSTILIDVAAPSTSTRSIRNVDVSGNVIYSPHVHAIRAGATAGTTGPLSSITNATLRSHENISITNNQVIVNLNGNPTVGNRAVRSIWCGAARSLTISGNSVTWPDSPFGSGWSTSSVSPPSYAFFIDHPLNLNLLNNVVEIQRAQTLGTYPHWCQVMAFVMAPGAFEIQSPLRGHWNVIGNSAIGTGNVEVNLSVGFLAAYTSGVTGVPQWTNKTAPRITGTWVGNYTTTGGTYTHTLQSTYPDYFVPGSGIDNSFLTEATAAALGGHDWYPSSGSLGTVITLPTGATAATMGPGWTQFDGVSLVTSLNWLKEIAWNQKLGLSATTTLPSAANTYIRLSGN